MLILGWVVRIVVLLIVIRAVLRLLYGLFDGLQGGDGRRPGAGGAARARGRGKAVPLVRDPVCGTYIVAGKALTSSSQGTTHYFCSEACRRTFERDRAASRTA
jgi:YHS domain-containing protein